MNLRLAALVTNKRTADVIVTCIQRNWIKPVGVAVYPPAFWTGLQRSANKGFASKGIFYIPADGEFALRKQYTV